MSRPLSGKERKMLAFIRSSVDAHGFPPSIREIGTAFGIRSTNGVRYYLRRLESEGYLRRNPRISRGIELVGTAVDSLLDGTALQGIEAIFARGGIPVLGRVAAGAPILAEENVDEVLYLEGFVAQHNDLFALRVKGDSMQDAGILDGDIVVVRSQPEAKSGEIIVALLDDEVTVKRFQKSPHGFALVPENEAYTPIILSPEAFARVQVLGRVTAVLRRYE